MLYFAMFDYQERVPETSPENGPCDNPAFFSAVVEAPNSTLATKRFRELIIRLHSETDLLLDAEEVYLNSMSAVPSVSSEAMALSWISIRPFGRSTASMSYTFFDATDDFSDAVHQENDNWDEARPFIDLSSREIRRPLYRRLTRKKQRGTLESFKSLSDGDLYALFVLEECTDQEMAELFNVTKSQVTYRRRKAGATLQERSIFQALKDSGILEEGDLNLS